MLYKLAALDEMEQHRLEQIRDGILTATPEERTEAARILSDNGITPASILNQETSTTTKHVWRPQADPDDDMETAHLKYIRENPESSPEEKADADRVLMENGVENISGVGYTKPPAPIPQGTAQGVLDREEARKAALEAALRRKKFKSYAKWIGSGAGIGALVGGGIGYGTAKNKTSGTLLGALIGGGVGAGGGALGKYLYDKHQKK